MASVAEQPTPTPDREPDNTSEMIETQAERIRRMQAKVVLANSLSIRQRVPEVPPYFALSHTINQMVTRSALTPEEYLRWTAGLMGAVKRPLYGSN